MWGAMSTADGIHDSTTGPGDPGGSGGGKTEDGTKAPVAIRRGSRGHDLGATADPSARTLTAAEFHQLGDVPAAAEWLANIDNPNTRRASTNDVGEFVAFCGIEHPDEFRSVSRAPLVRQLDFIVKSEIAFPCPRGQFE